MVLYYSNRNDNKIPNYIAQQIGDSIISINEGTISDEFHSERAFVLVIDCKHSSMFEVHNKLQFTRFTGSKILYCFFLSPSAPQLINDAAKIFAGAKELVLFGYDTLYTEPDGIVNGKEQAHMQSQLRKIIDCCPFDSNEQVNFPYCGRVMPQARSI